VHLNAGGPTPRAAHSMCSYGQYLVIFGGRDAESRTNDLHIYDTGKQLACYLNLLHISEWAVRCNFLFCIACLVTRLSSHGHKSL